LLYEEAEKVMEQHVSDSVLSAPGISDNSVEPTDLLVERECELHFFDTRPELEQQLAGQWAAIDGDELISHGTDLTAVLQSAENAGHPNPLVTRVFDPAITYVY